MNCCHFMCRCLAGYHPSNVGVLPRYSSTSPSDGAETTVSCGATATLNPPGISLLRAPSPGEAARQIREAFPAADALHEAAQGIGSTTVDKIRQAGFDVLPNPTKKLPNHYRLIHSEGVAGFNNINLARLSAVFTETSGHAS
jgi:hypothetical protein